MEHFQRLVRFGGLGYSQRRCGLVQQLPGFLVSSEEIVDGPDESAKGVLLLCGRFVGLPKYLFSVSDAVLGCLLLDVCLMHGALGRVPLLFSLPAELLVRCPPPAEFPLQ